MLDVTPPEFLQVPDAATAAKNIDGARVFDLHPDHFGEMSEHLKPQADAADSGLTDVSPVVSNYAQKSLSNTGLIRGPSIGQSRTAASEDSVAPPVGDATKHSLVESMFNYTMDRIKNGWKGDQTLTDKTNEFIDKPVNERTDDDQTDLEIAKRNEKYNFKDYGLTPNEQILGNVVGSFPAMAADIWNNKGLAISGALGGATLGYKLGKAPGAITGALFGGVDLPLAYSTYRNTRASVYNDLTDAKDAQGKDLNVDETTKKNVATGVATVNSAIQLGAGFFMAKALPGAGSLITPNTIKAILADPGQAALKRSLFRVGESMATLGGMNASMTAVKTFAESFAKNYTGEPGSMENALSITVSDLKKATPQVLRSGAEGALTGAAFAAGAEGVRATLPKSESTIDVGNGPENIQSLKQYAGEGTPTEHDKALQAAHVGNALEQINKISSDTDMAKHAPGELVQLHKDMEDAGGSGNIYIDQQDLQDLGKGKMRKFAERVMMGKTYANEPVALPIHEFLALTREFPQAHDLGRLEPDGPSFGEAEKTLQKPIMEHGADFSGIANRIKEVQPKTITLESGEKVILKAEMHTPEGETASGNKFADTPAVKAYDESGKEIGVLEVGGNFQGKKFVTSSSMTRVSQEMQRKGVGTEMYNFANERLAKLWPSENQTPAGKAFWEERIASKEKSKETKAHLTEMRNLKKVETPAEEGATVRIDLPVPSHEEISSDARSAVNDMKVSDLDVRQHLAGERTSVEMAEEAQPKGELLKAFNARENAAKSSELARHTQMAIKRVKGVQDLIQKLSIPENLDLLKSADRKYSDAVTEILGRFSLDKSKVDETKDGATEKYEEKAVEKGGITGPGLTEIQVKDGLSNMTVSEAMRVGDELKNIVKNSEMKDRLFNNPEGKVDSFREQIQPWVDQLLAHPLYREELTKKKDVYQTGITDKMRGFFGETVNQVDQVQQLLLTADRMDVSGESTTRLFKPLRDGEINRKLIMKEFAAHMAKIIDIFGKKEFDRLYTDTVHVPEFVGHEGLGKDGNITKAHLLALELNWGNEGNLKVIDQYGLDREVIRTVLDRELREDHTVLAQNMRDVYKSFYPKIQELQMRTEGTEFEAVNAKPYQARGKEVAGGYYPIFRLSDDITADQEALMGIKDLNSLKQNMSAQSVTEQGHLISRTRGEGLLDPDMKRYFFNVHQVAHDLTMREAVRDVSKTLAHPSVANALTGIVGPEGYRNMVDHVIQSATEVDRTGYDKTSGHILKMINYLAGGARAVAVGFKITSAAKAPAALFGVADKMGAWGYPHILNVVTKMGATLPMMGEYYKLAQEIDPTIQDVTANITHSASENVLKLVPTKRNFPVDLVKNAAQFMNNLGMLAVAGSHQFTKVVSVLAAYDQARAGHAEGVPVTGDPVKDHAAFSDYARRISTLALPHGDTLYQSPLMNNRVMKPLLAMFMSDATQSMNNTHAVLREAKARYEETKSAAAKADLTNATKFAALGVGGLARHIITVMTLRSTYLALVTMAGPYATYQIAKSLVGNKADKPERDDDDSTLAMKLTKNVADDYLSGVPLARNMYQPSAAPQNSYTSKEFHLPIIDELSMIKNAATGLTALISEGPDSVDQSQAKAMLYSLGYGLHLPIDAAYKYLGSPDLTDVHVKVPNPLAPLAAAISKAKEVTEKTPEQGFTPEQIAELEAIDAKLNAQAEAATPKPKAVAKQEEPEEPQPHAIDDFMTRIRHAEGGVSTTVKNPITSATGRYQFIEETWDSVRKQLAKGVKMNGKLYKENLPENAADATAEQQDTAMKFLTFDNAKILAKKGIQINDVSLYMAHVLPVSQAAKILAAPDNAKIRNLGVNPAYLRANAAAFGTTNMKVDSLTVEQAKTGLRNWLQDSDEAAALGIGTIQYRRSKLTNR